MKTSYIQGFGGPDVVELGNAPASALQAHESAVRIEMASVNPLDLKMIAGYMQQVFPVTFPYTPGTDFSGVIDAVGSAVTHLKPGDRVVGRTAPGAGGAFAKRLVMAASDLVAIPEEMSFEQAASLPTAFGAARQGLFDAGLLKPGQRVLIHAGAGGVGIMAVQLAHHASAYVIATASGKNIDLVKSLGADEVIDYRTDDFTQLRDVDLVLDTMGGDVLEQSWSVLGPGGRIASLVAFDIKSKSDHTGAFVFFAEAASVLPEAIKLFLAGRLQIITDTIFHLDDTRAALEKLSTGHARGKVLIRTSN
ncbi:NADP-dependent oxidoreductase [Glaciimonas immobilis]|uniref:NADPH:quinone reductase-like Zn-dependent oxidoreductase n=1 Tax=Glaciimonas immobilis TaxID=728004 RepID=A0A840RQU8_9BURK|nr:NADP-dependent oxidoreductase [Glaciimonas immobilis]KAF3998188.1 NADP-dependent oxidoreductase [Glaciimonas immobilis]MBB5199094.1 NADPH:quinone reductase-like Zn-dependent oxidoreductase [Glaciimonas immobilis]